MLKQLYSFFDFFLPRHLLESLDITTIFRARSLTASAFIGFILVLLLLVGTIILHVSLVVWIFIFCCFVINGSVLIYLKTRTKNFERSLTIAAIIQISVLFLAVYLSAFSARGMGFFGLIWLIPLIIMAIAYLRPKAAIVCILINALVVSCCYVFLHNRFYLPMKIIYNFKELYLYYLAMVLIASAILIFFFIQLNELLEEELGKQRSLLIESAKFQSLGKMASNLAHDINNPLFTIQGKLHQIRNLFSQDKLDLDKCDQIVDEVEGTILRLSQIVKGVSTFARQGHGDQMVSVSAEDLIRGMVLLSSDRIVQNGITFEVQVVSSIRIICYPSYISQVLINLLNNAIDALEGAEVKVIKIEVLMVDKWIEIHVKDSGKGVTPEIESKIFDSFFTTKKYGKGTGLGLSISKGLIELHEGEIKYTRFGNMTDFIVRLPSYK